MLKSFFKGLTWNVQICVIVALVILFLLLLSHPEIIDKLESLAKGIPLIICVRMPTPPSKPDPAHADEQICHVAPASPEAMPPIPQR